MGQQEKQKSEDYYYKSFAKAYGLPLTCEVKDKPDIRIKHNEKNIGIEITTFHLKKGSDISSEPQQSPIRERVLKEAQRLYQKQNNSEIKVIINFNIIENEKGLPEKIVNWLEKQKFTSNEALPPKSYREIPELNFVYINIDPFDTKWENQQRYSIPDTSIADLQNIINEKEEKKYDNTLDEIWLLIVIDYANFGMDQVPNNVKNSKFN